MSHYQAQQDEFVSNTQRVRELERQLAELKEEIEEDSLRVGWRESYYFLDSFFSVKKDREEGHHFDEQRAEIGNYFASIAEAERFKDYLIGNNKFTIKALEFANGYEFSKGGENEYVVWSHELGSWQARTMRFLRESPSPIYMDKDAIEGFLGWLNRNMPEGLN